MHNNIVSSLLHSERVMPKMDCLGGCGKQVRNPPGKNVTGYCAVCLGLAHKKGG